MSASPSYPFAETSTTCILMRVDALLNFCLEGLEFLADLADLGAVLTKIQWPGCTAEGA